MGLGRDPVGELRRALAGLLAVGGALALFLAAGQSPAEGRANMRVTDASGASPGRLAASADGAWNETGSLRDVHRLGHTATLLKNGKVLVVGGADNNGTPLASAELYDPKSGTWADTAPLKTPRLDHSATLLADGRVLVAGGKGPGTLGSAELYDPDSGTWTQTAPMDSPSYDHTGTLLSGSPATCGVNCGKVVVAGGCCNASRGPIFGSELYDPATNSWAATTIGSVYSHSGHSATFLAAPSPALCGANCGRVLVVGGAGGVSPGVFSDVNPELYDPRVDRSTLTGDQRIRRWSHTATLLESGKVLVAGGSTRQFATILRQAELYDPLSGTWAETGSLNTPRDGHAATLLSGGKVLVAGGRNPGAAALASAEIYDPAAGSWTAVASMVRPRAGSGFSEGPTATLLTGGPALCGSNCGKVLVAGGSGDRSAELFTAPAPPPPPAASIDDTAVVEGDSGEKDVTFTVSLSAASANSVTVDFATADDSATQPADYAARSGTLTFAPGQTSKTVAVQVRGDTLDEPDERFSVNLSNAQNATTADPQGIATITDDDAPPSLSINDTTVAEGNSGTTDATFTVSLSAASAKSVSVDFATADDSATQPADYAARSGTLTFAPGQTSKTVAVQVRGDTLDEPDERFSVNLSNPQNATTADPQGIATITDDDDPPPPPAIPTASIDDTTVVEGNSGTTDATFTVSLSAASAKSVSVDFATADDSATQPADYAARSGTLTFAPGQTSKTVAVQVRGDTLDEPDERFSVNLSNPQNATTADPQGIATITDDDDPPPPSLSINDTTVAEGNSGTTDATFTVSLSGASSSEVSVNFATADDSATQPADYAARSGTLTFAPGQTSRTVTVQVRGDTLDEPDERFSVNLSNPQNATIADSEGTATISDDDPPPSLSLDDTTVVEGDSGEKDAAFTVSLSAASANSVTVDLATADDSAAQPGDYAFRGETLTFAPGQTSKTVAVQVRGDTVDEPDERFSVNLASPQNATTADAEGIGTITDDDPPAGPGAANPPPAGAPGPGYGGIKDKGRGRDRRKGCVKFRRGVRGRRLGPARLGRTRKAQRSLFKKAKLRPRGGVDRYCITGGGALRIAYPTARLIRPLGRSQRKRIRTRAVLVLTSSRRYQIRGIRPGSGVRNLHRRLRGERRVRVGASVWYIAPGRATRLAFRVRGRRVREIGLADKRLIPSHRAAKRLLRAWRL